ncbi:MAG: CDP-diacylglycerol--glycerol-3-phosphate 3-phosphatidyltransferase [Gammaproteobacteria bacterium]|nr:CDP-diacylglycerol--glycerol-3-phosphate 3-phosphatidyltransferase [Gammaproteobacteria bacterium]
MYKHIPNFLTLSRIAIIPVVIVIFCLPWQYNHIVAATLFLLASITDGLDGYLARRWQVVSQLGVFLDPVADKLLVSSALVLLVAQHAYYLAIPALIIIGREIAVSALREWMAELGKQAKVKVTQVAKVKTFIQMLAITLLLVDQEFVTTAGYVALYVAAILTLWSMAIYLMIAWQELNKSTTKPLDVDKNT